MQLDRQVRKQHKYLIVKQAELVHGGWWLEFELQTERDKATEVTRYWADFAGWWDVETGNPVSVGALSADRTGFPPLRGL